MNRTIRIAALLLTALFFITVVPPETVYAGTSSNTCIKNGCYKSRYGQSVYCKNHTWYAKESSCCISGCNRTKQLSSNYCNYHYNLYCVNSNKPSGSTGNTNSSSSSLSSSNTSSSRSTGKGKTYSSSSSKSHKKYYDDTYEDSYDKGYEDIWLDDDYDDDRYEWDDDYALGVDDAMEDEDW